MAETPRAIIDVYNDLPNEEKDVCSSNNFLDCLTFKETIDASHADFGIPLQSGKPKPGDGVNRPKRLVLPPSNDELLCKGGGLDSLSNDLSDSIVLIPRGICSFEQKAIKAFRLGAEGVIIYNNLRSRYSMNYRGSPMVFDNDDIRRRVPMDDIVWPMNKVDYECQNARAWIPKEYFSFEPLPYNDTVNDFILTGSIYEGNLCALEDESHPEELFETNCESKRCLLTGSNKIVTELMEYEVMEACCAWDIHQKMSGTSSPYVSSDDKLEIPITFVTMRDGDKLLNLLIQSKNDNEDVLVVMYERYYPRWNVSTYLVLFLAVFTNFLASWISASDLRRTRKALETTDIILAGTGGAGAVSINADIPANIPVSTVNTTHDYDAISIDNVDNVHSGEVELQDLRQNNTNSAATHVTVGSNEADNVNREADEADLIEQRRDGTNSPSPRNFDEEDYYAYDFSYPSSTFEIRMLHIGAFLVVGSITLFILYFAQVNNIFIVFYAMGGILALVTIFFFPLYRWIGAKLGIGKQIERSICRRFQFCGFSSLRWIDVLSISSATVLGLTWLIVAYGYIFRKTEINAAYWVIHDLMGICICILFIKSIRAASIKVATLLILAFFIYNVLLAFVTPFLFNGISSDMTSDNNEVDAYICEKYPDDPGCVRIIPFPMFLSIPAINDYRGGAIAVMLTNIIIPGLLISYGARLDASKKVVSAYAIRRRLARRGRTDISRYFLERNATVSWRKKLSSYFVWLLISYVLGLFLAYILISFTNAPTAVFLYLAPIILSTIICLGWKKRELEVIWKGHKTVKFAQRIVDVYQFIGPSRIGTFPLDDDSDGDTISVGSSNPSLGESIDFE